MIYIRCLVRFEYQPSCPMKIFLIISFLILIQSFFQFFFSSFSVLYQISINSFSILFQFFFKSCSILFHFFNLFSVPFQNFIFNSFSCLFQTFFKSYAILFSILFNSFSILSQVFLKNFSNLSQILSNPLKSKFFLHMYLDMHMYDL